jgi:acetolactate decarboxylase
VVLTICLFLLSCNKNKVGEVEYTGELRKMMMGDISPGISLQSLSQSQNLYALGAVENLKGEIQIFDGLPINSFVNGEGVSLDRSFEKNATLLVYAAVGEWRSLNISRDFKSRDDLEVFIFESAASTGIDTNKPFPFLLAGEIKALDWHVINWDENDKNHTHQKHRESGISGNLKDSEVEILGFYSKRHKGVFTHHSTNMHLHFKTRDENIAGHVDKFILGTKMTLRLPKQ